MLNVLGVVLSDFYDTRYKRCAYHTDMSQSSVAPEKRLSRGYQFLGIEFLDKIVLLELQYGSAAKSITVLSIPGVCS